jgi:alcohol dehydrogenase
MDALVHALESLMSRNGNPYAEGLALQVIRTVHCWLPAAVSDGADMEARSQMLLAAHVAGLAFGSGTGLGLCHALAHSISAHTHATHGVALTVVLPAVLGFNLPSSADKLALAAGSLGVPGSSADDGARAAISTIENLGRYVVQQRTVSELGATETMIPALVRDTLSDIVIGNTPRTPSEEEVRELLVTTL